MMPRQQAEADEEDKDRSTSLISSSDSPRPSPILLRRHSPVDILNSLSLHKALQKLFDILNKNSSKRHAVRLPPQLRRSNRLLSVFYASDEWAQFSAERQSNERHLTSDCNSDSFAPYDQKGSSGTGRSVMQWPDGVCDITTRTIELAKTGSVISFAEAGPADASTSLLYIHGWGESWRVWQRTLQAQQKLGPFQRRIIAVDLRDFGNSKSGRRLQGCNSVEHMTDDLIALIDELKIERVSVVAHSLGSIIGLQLALEHPARVASLLLCSAEASFAGNAAVKGWQSQLDALSGSTPSSLRTLHSLGCMHRGWQRGACIRPTSYKRLHRCLDEQPFRGRFRAPTMMLQHDLRRVQRSVLTKSLQSIMEMDIESDLCLVSCPTTLVRGDLDTVSSRQDQQQLLDSIPHATLRQIPYAANLIPVEQPERLARIIQNYAFTNEEHFVAGDGFHITNQAHLQKTLELANLDDDCFLANKDYNHPDTKSALENQVNSQHSSL